MGAEHDRERVTGGSRGERSERLAMREAEVGPVNTELARVRARFGVDPATARRSLADAWTSPSGTMEEEEAEFLDAVADCLSVGLSLEAAIVSWGAGSLASDDEQASHEGGEEGGEEVDEGGAIGFSTAAIEHHHPPGRRRFVR